MGTSVLAEQLTINGYTYRAIRARGLPRLADSSLALRVLQRPANPVLFVSEYLRAYNSSQLVSGCILKVPNASLPSLYGSCTLRSLMACRDSDSDLARLLANRPRYRPRVQGERLYK